MNVCLLLVFNSVFEWETISLLVLNVAEKIVELEALRKKQEEDENAALAAEEEASAMEEEILVLR